MMWTRPHGLIHRFVALAWRTRDRRWYVFFLPGMEWVRRVAPVCFVATQLVC